MILLIFNSLFCQYHKFKQSKKHRFTNSKKLINANDLVIFFEANGLGIFSNPYSRFSSRAAFPSHERSELAEQSGLENKPQTSCNPLAFSILAMNSSNK